MREAALKRAGQSPLLSGTFSPTKLDRDDFLRLNAPLPLGLPAPHPLRDPHRVQYAIRSAR